MFILLQLGHSSLCYSWWNVQKLAIWIIKGGRHTFIIVIFLLKDQWLAVNMHLSVLIFLFSVTVILFVISILIFPLGFLSAIKNWYACTVNEHRPRFVIIYLLLGLGEVYLLELLLVFAFVYHMWLWKKLVPYMQINIKIIVFLILLACR